MNCPFWYDTFSAFILTASEPNASWISLRVSMSWPDPRINALLTDIVYFLVLFCHVGAVVVCGGLAVAAGVTVCLLIFSASLSPLVCWLTHPQASLRSCYGWTSLYFHTNHQCCFSNSTEIWWRLLILMFLFHIGSHNLGGKKEQLFFYDNNCYLKCNLKAVLVCGAARCGKNNLNKYKNK